MVSLCLDVHLLYAISFYRKNFIDGPTISLFSCLSYVTVAQQTVLFHSSMSMVMKTFGGFPPPTHVKSLNLDLELDDTMGANS